jgi:hypothetical protein
MLTTISIIVNNKNDNNFHDLKTTKLGSYGEGLVADWLKGKGYTVYSPTNTGSHPVDFFAISDQKQFLVEVKTKCKLPNTPDTGLDFNDYKKYEELNKTNEVLIVFVDAKTKKIYGNWFNNLKEQTNIDNFTYPRKIKTRKTGFEIILFHTSSLKTMRLLTEKEIQTLKK